MKIVLKKTSFIDYPGKISSVFFFPGCNLRCPWCHNGDIISEKPVSAGVSEIKYVEIEEGIAHLVKRRSVLGGVVLSGGEPTIQVDLPQIIQQIKSLNLRVKIDTNGINPDALRDIFGNDKTRPDYIALDLKVAPERYGELAADKTKKEASQLGQKLFESVNLIKSSGIEHEFRTLSLPEDFFSDSDIEALSQMVNGSSWYFRPFKPGNCLNSRWNSYRESRLETVKKHAQKAISLGKNGIAL